MEQCVFKAPRKVEGTEIMIDQNTQLSELVAQAARQFAQHYGRKAKWFVAAPGRVNIIGEHTDYNEGYVLPMAIERYTVLAADRALKMAGPVPQVSWYCGRTHKQEVFPLDHPVPQAAPRHWSNYVRGVFEGCQKHGLETGGLDVYMTSTVPLGGGLSSSAALEVAAATLIEAATGTKLDAVKKALICQEAEQTYAGMPCGIMDQFTSVMGQPGHLLLLDCRSRAIRLVPMKSHDVTILIVNTNVRHELTGSEYPQRRRQCESAAQILGVPALRDATLAELKASESKLDATVYRRARHVIGEIERTLKAAEAIAAGDWAAVGPLMYASHESLRTDYEVSCRELDAVVEAAQTIGPAGGMIGCRMTGGGFGGCAVSVVRTQRVAEIARRIGSHYEQTTRIKPSFFVSHPASGASIAQP
jgi:galactokinase